MAAGLPTEGTNRQKPRAGDTARKDTPTCALDERVGDVSDRVRATGWDSCVVVNEQRVVFGLLRAKELAKDRDLLIEQAMRPGPSTFRPFVSLQEMAHFMTEHQTENAPITTSDGRLVGLLLRQDAIGAQIRVMIAKVETRTKKCTKCGRLIEVCVGCDEPGCPAPICNDRLRIETGQAMRQPHTHGG